jgi:hypothetical protein
MKKGLLERLSPLKMSTLYLSSEGVLGGRPKNFEDLRLLSRGMRLTKFKVDIFYGSQAQRIQTVCVTPYTIILDH